MEVKVKGMNCQSCVRKITTKLKDLGVKRVKISLFDAKVNFKENKKVSLDEIKEAIVDLGFEID